jgi:hypothetical protein
VDSARCGAVPDAWPQTLMCRPLRPAASWIAYVWRFDGSTYTAIAASPAVQPIQAGWVLHPLCRAVPRPCQRCGVVVVPAGDGGHCWPVSLTCQRFDGCTVLHRLCACGLSAAPAAGTLHRLCAAVAGHLTAASLTCCGCTAIRAACRAVRCAACRAPCGPASLTCCGCVARATLHPLHSWAVG